MSVRLQINGKKQQREYAQHGYNGIKKRLAHTFTMRKPLVFYVFFTTDFVDVIEF